MQFKHLQEDYSEIMIVCYSNYINEVFKTISNFTQEASKLNEAIDSFDFVDAYTKILRVLQGIIGFINFLQSHTIDFNKALLKCIQILEKIVSKNEIKDIEEVNRIIRLLKKIVEKENSLFDDHEKIQKKIIKIRTKIFNLYEKNKKTKVCKAFNYISLACYFYLSFTKPNTPQSNSIFKFLFLLQSFSINVQNSAVEKSDRNVDMKKWSQTTIESIHSYSSLINDYNNHENEPQQETESNDEREAKKTNLKQLLDELNDIIESSKGQGFDKLCSNLQVSRIDLIEKLDLEPNIENDDNDDENDDEDEKHIDLLGQSLAQKEGNTSVYSSFYSDDLDTKFAKSLPQKYQRNRYSTYHISPLAIPIPKPSLKEGSVSEFDPRSIEKLTNTSFSARDSDSTELSTSEFRSLDLSYQRRRSRKKLISSHSIFHLSPMSSGSFSSSSFSFRVTSRKPILVSSDSPIKIKPSGRHLTFLLPNEDDETEATPRNKKIPSIQPYPSNVDTELLMPFIPNPPFVGWSVSYLLQKVTFSTLPTTNYEITAPKFQFSVFKFHLPPIKQLIEESNDEPDYITVTDDEKDIEKEIETDKKSKKKRKSLIHFRKKKKEPKQKKEHEGSSTKRKSWFRKSEMDKKSSAVIKEVNSTLRKCWKILRNAKGKNDQFGRLQAVSEWYKPVSSCIMPLVNYSKDFPNNEFIVDAVREYERIRVEFDEILNEIEFIKGQTMIESIQQSSKQLSMILVSLDIYINNENVANKSKLLSYASKVMGYLTNILCNLQIICDCLDPSSFIACSNFILNLWKALNEFYPIFSDLESYVKKSILAFSAKSILLTLKPAVMILYQINNKLNFSKSSSSTDNNEESGTDAPLVNEDIVFSDDQIEEQVTFLKKVSNDLLNSSSVKLNNNLYVTMIADLFNEMINLPTFMNPLFITDLNELGNVVESTFIEMQLQNENNLNNNYNNFDEDSKNGKIKTLSEEFDAYTKDVLTTNDLKNCMTVLAAIRKLQFMLTVKLGREFNDAILKEDEEKPENDESSSKHSTESDASNEAEEISSITNREFVSLVTQNEADFSELADIIQVNSSEIYSSNSLRILTKNWFESIFQITFGFVDLLKVSPILNKQPYLYSQVDSYYEMLLGPIDFFKNTAKAKINVSLILDHLIANIKHTQYYARTKPFEIIEETKEEDEDESKKDKKKKKKDKEKEKDNNDSNLSKFDNFPLFEPKFDLEKYKCGFFVKRIPIYKRALFADFILSIVAKLREPHAFPQKAMDYMTTFYIQVFTSLVNIANQLKKDEEKEKEEDQEEPKNKKNKGKNDNKNELNKDYFLLLLINRERDNVLRLRYSEEKSSFHYGEENHKKLLFLLSLGEFLANYVEFASILSDDDQKAQEIRKKSGRKRRHRRKNNDSNTRQRRGRVGEEFTIEGLTVSDSDNKITDSDLEDNHENNEKEENNNNNNKNNSGSDNSNYYSDENSSDNQTTMVFPKDAKEKLKEMRHSCKVTISHLKKYSKKMSKSLIQPFNLIIRAKPANVKTFFMSSETLSSTLIDCLQRIQFELKSELKTNKSVNFIDEGGQAQISGSGSNNSINFSSSIIINKNESSGSIGDNENDKTWTEIKETFNSIISPLQSIRNDHELYKSSEKNDDEKTEEEENNKDDDDDNLYTAGVYFEKIYSDIVNIPLILECSYEKSARLFSRIASKISIYAKKSLNIPFSESLTTLLIDQFTTLLQTTRNRYLRSYKEQLESGSSNNEEKKEENEDENEEKRQNIIDDKVQGQFELLKETSKTLLQRELIENSNDQQLLIMILSQKLIEKASNLHPISEDYSFVLKTIMNMSIAVLNAYNKNGKNKNRKNENNDNNDNNNNYAKNNESSGNNDSLDFESLKMFVASFDYFIETLVKEMDNEVLSDEILHVISELEKLPMHIPGYYAPKLCLRFLLIEADNEEDEDEN